MMTLGNVSSISIEGSKKGKWEESVLMTEDFNYRCSRAVK
jgi:hypothetical protein